MYIVMHGYIKYTGTNFLYIPTLSVATPGDSRHYTVIGLAVVTGIQWIVILSLGTLLITVCCIASKCRHKGI